MDTGICLKIRMKNFVLMAPKTVFAQAKTYYGGGEWYTLELRL